MLVDPRVLESSDARPPVPDAEADSLREMDRRMREALENEKLNVTDKANAYQQILWKYLKRVDQFKENPPVTVPPLSTPSQTPRPETSPISSVEKDVLESVPKKLKSKAERLLRIVNNHPDLVWSPRGEIVWQGRVIENSNAVDLINDALRRRRVVQSPSGWETFATALKEANAPRDLVGNPDRWRFMTRTQTPITPHDSRRSVDKDDFAKPLTPPPSLSARKRTTPLIKRRKKRTGSPLWEEF